MPVIWCLSSNGFICNKQYFVLDAIYDRQPVKISKDRCYVVILFSVSYYSSSTILNSLKSTYIIVRHAIQ